MVNEYLQLYNETGGQWLLAADPPVRLPKIKKYAHAVPTKEALDTIAQYSPIIEIGAGTGYWAYLLEKQGATALPFDLHPPKYGRNNYHEHWWMHVRTGGPGEVKRYPKHTLFLCWPPPDDTMAHHALQCYAGEIVIYIGEWTGACANEAFFVLLEKEFEQIKIVNIPQWDGMHDYMTVWKRKEKEG